MVGKAFAADYLKLASGSVGRLVIALAYFLVAANVLSLSDFGLFATSSALGVILSRVAGFGFISPVFRAATVKPRLTGTYLAGFLILFALSLPLVALMAWAIHAVLFTGMPFLAFALVITAEVAGWRMLEVVSIINNGQRQFGRASVLVLAGSLIRTVAALAFWWGGYTSLTEWSWFYASANLAAALLAWTAFAPRARLRFRPELYLARASDALSAAAADIVFYLQAELDKAVVLAAAGPRIAGLYAIAMRIIDITAMPVRVFNQLAMQDVMTRRGVAFQPGRMMLTELGIGIVSVAALAGVTVLLWVNPDLLGRNIGSASALFPLLMAVPAFRNLIEYHAELLYGLQRTELRALLLGTIAVFKALLIWLAIQLAGGELGWAIWVNGIFLVLYGLSATATYTAIRAARHSA